MKRRVTLSLIFTLCIFCACVACHKIQIDPGERPPQEQTKQAPHEKAAQEKTTPQAAPQPQAKQKKVLSGGTFQKVAPQDNFTRIYPVDFDSFHPQVIAALQDHANSHKGNSFRISRLGSDTVILRGVYLRDGDRERYVPTLSIKAINPQECQVQIALDSSAQRPFPSNPAEAAKEIFQIIEKATGKAVQ